MQKFAIAAGRPLALTLRRGSDRVTVMSRTPALGQWEPCPAETVTLDTNPDPRGLINWEVLAGPGGRCDLHALRPARLALILPMFWLLQMRLWLALVTLLTALLAAAVVSPWLAVGVYAISALHFWRQAPSYVRSDRMARGFWPTLVLAAPSESEAMTQYRMHHPEARFIYERTTPAATAPAAEANQTAAAAG